MSSEGFSVTMLRTCPADKLGCSLFLLNKVRRKYNEEGVLCLDADVVGGCETKINEILNTLSAI